MKDLQRIIFLNVAWKRSTGRRFLVERLMDISSCLVTSCSLGPLLLLSVRKLVGADFSQTTSVKKSGLVNLGRHNNTWAPKYTTDAKFISSPECTTWQRAAPTPKGEASHFRMISFSGSKCTKNDSAVIARFATSSDFCSCSDHTHFRSFWSNRYRGFSRVEDWFINRLYW